MKKYISQGIFLVVVLLFSLPLQAGTKLLEYRVQDPVFGGEVYVAQAGASLSGRQAAVQSEGESVLLFSLSSIHSPFNMRPVHDFMRLNPGSRL